ncbi:MAG: phosphatidylglycerophosphatase A [Bryobacteraceae bacterium]
MSSGPRTRIAFAIATWFGCGRSPWAPGTVGSAAAVAIAIALHRYAGFAPWHFLLLAAALAGPAVWAAGVAESVSGIKDPGFVVVDEVLGQWIALAAAHPWNWISCLAAFALFRLFDIWKPPPVRQLESLPGGLGINADDWMAGLYAALVLLLAECFNLY